MGQLHLSESGNRLISGWMDGYDRYISADLPGPPHHRAASVFCVSQKQGTRSSPTFVPSRYQLTAHIRFPNNNNNNNLIIMFTALKPTALMALAFAALATADPTCQVRGPRSTPGRSVIFSPSLRPSPPLPLLSILSSERPS